LCELRTAWGQADRYTHVNQFLSSDEHLSALPDSLSVNLFEEELRVLRYSQLKGLTDELKRLGAHNMNAGQQIGLTGRERVKRFKAAYEAQRLSDGSIPATYQVFYGVFEKRSME
jgi:malonyl-CoA O-methyltransferase